jgi:hypothetical protein
MMTLPAGTYLVVGPETEPRVVVLTKHQHDVFVAGLTLVAKYERQRDYLFAQTFGRGIDRAFAAWGEDLMTLVAETYEGPYRALVRGLAAAIVCDITFEVLLTPKNGKDGGARDRLQPKPVKPRPGGVAVALPR